jgi:hypothetical protein
MSPDELLGTSMSYCSRCLSGRQGSQGQGREVRNGVSKKTQEERQALKRLRA